MLKNPFPSASSLDLCFPGFHWWAPGRGGGTHSGPQTEAPPSRQSGRPLLFGERRTLPGSSESKLWNLGKITDNGGGGDGVHVPDFLTSRPVKACVLDPWKQQWLYLTSYPFLLSTYNISLVPGSEHR